MSKDAVARAYIQILKDNKDGHSHMAAFDALDLSEHEKSLLQDEAGSRTSVPDEGPVMSYLRGGQLAPRLASDLGAALNRFHGLPTESLQEPGYRTSTACCPWGHPKVPELYGMME